MSDIQIFNNEEFGEVRTLEINGEPWFIGKDLTEALNYGNPRQALITNVDEEDKGVHEMDTPGGKQEMTIINESGLYSLVLGSKLPNAKKFKRWITHEVIPDIRKHGIYATDNVINQILNNPDFGIELLETLKKERAARVEAERKNAILTHVNKTYTMTEIAKELNLPSAKKLNDILKEKKIQYKVNDTWVFYSKYSNLGYEDIKQEVLDNGKVVYHRKITQMGREFILNLLKEGGTNGN